MASSNVAVVAAASPSNHVVAKSGPLFLSALCHWTLFGVLCCQFTSYISGFSKDRRRNKLFVYAIVALEVVQTAILTKDYYRIFGYGFGDPQSADPIGTLWLGVPIMSGIIAFLTQGFYAMRVYSLLDSCVVPIAICALAMIELGGAIANGIVAKQVEFYSRLHESEAAFSITPGVWFGAGAVCDVVIAYSMCHFLWKRRDEGVNKTRNLINGIIRRVVATGALTALLGVSVAILALYPSRIPLFLVPSAAISKLYSNSLLSLLNHRQNLKSTRYNKLRGAVANDTPQTTLRFAETFIQSDFSLPKDGDEVEKREHNVDHRTQSDAAIPGVPNPV